MIYMYITGFVETHCTYPIMITAILYLKEVTLFFFKLT